MKTKLLGYANHVYLGSIWNRFYKCIIQGQSKPLLFSRKMLGLNPSGYISFEIGYQNRLTHYDFIELVSKYVEIDILLCEK